MKLKRFTLCAGMVSIAIAGTAQPKAFASARVLKDDAKKLLTLESELIFYGGDSVIYGPQAADEIRRLWNESTPKIKIGESDYTVQFKIDARYVSEQQACDDARANSSFG